jgi:hypothetical protein
MSKDKKTLTEKIEEAAKRPLPYEGLISSSEDAFWPDEGDEDSSPASAANPKHREDLTSLLIAAVQKHGSED